MGQKKLLAARPDVPSLCFVSTNIVEYFGSLANDVEEAVGGVLDCRTVAGTLAQMRRLEIQRSVRKPSLEGAARAGGRGSGR